MVYINGLVQDCSISSVLEMKILQSCTGPSISMVQMYQSTITCLIELANSSEHQAQHHSNALLSSACSAYMGQHTVYYIIAYLKVNLHSLFTTNQR